MLKILIIDTEEKTVQQLKSKLIKYGFQVELCLDGNNAHKVAYQQNPDIILLDLLSKNKLGLEVCKKIRRITNCPIIFLSEQRKEAYKVEGFESGADDFIEKPFSFNELLARIKAHIRRHEKMSKSNAVKYNFQELEVFPETYQVIRVGEDIDLTQLEFDLLLFFIRNTGRVYSREQLLEAVWGFDYHGDVRTVDVTIHRLREKIEKDPQKPEYILTKRGFGYYFKGN